MNIVNIYKNGGFPPIQYCPDLNINKKSNDPKSNERFFSNVPKQNINIKELLSNNKKEAVIIIDNKDDELEIIN
jgi:hypothetical protein